MPGRSIRTDHQHPNGILPVRPADRGEHRRRDGPDFQSDGDRSGAEFSVSPFAPADPLEAGLPAAIGGGLEEPAGFRGKKIAPLIRDTYLLSTAWDPGAFNEFKKLRLEIARMPKWPRATLVTEAWKPVPTRVLPAATGRRNGRHRQSGATAFSTAAKVSDDRRFTRLDLAKWLVSPENPLTARAFVNRHWKQILRQRLSAVVDDLGAAGRMATTSRIARLAFGRFAKRVGRETPGES